MGSHQDKIHGVKCTMPYKKRREKIYVCEESASQPVMFANTTNMHARHTHVLTRVQLTSTLPKSRRNHSMVVANYSPVGKTQQKTRKLHFKFPLPKMTPHECHMLKINVQLCILLLLHLFSSVHIGPYNCFFSSMNKSK